MTGDDPDAAILPGHAPGQPSIFGDAFNPRPWTLADSSLNFFVDPETMKTIDFDGTEPPQTPPWLNASSGATDGQSQPPQPDASGFTGLTPWRPGASDNLRNQEVVTHQPAPSLPNDDASVAAEQTPPPSPGGATAQVGEYILPGLGKTYLDPQFADKVGTFIQAAQAQNIPLTFSSGYRDRSKQAGLKTDPNAMTPAENSLHSAGRAVDINWDDLNPNDQTKLLSAAADAGLIWGGNFRTPDRRHFFSDTGTDRNRLIDNFSRGIAALRNQIQDN